jgi:(2R)-ethylmalonyl-CoA mutase
VLSADARVNALQLPGFREAMSLPDQAEQLIGLRTQQVLMHETGITDYVDIFEGSKIIEKLTADTMANAREIAMRMRAAGFTKSIGIVSSELTRQLSERQGKLESGEITQIGVNAFPGEIGLAPRAAHQEDSADYDAIASERVASIAKWRESRDNRAVATAREELERAASQGGDMMQATLGLARAGGTVGEWTASLERVTHGRYTPVILDRSSTAAPLHVPTASSSKRIRIAIGKAGLDGHINAVKLLAQACMQAGMEVVLAGFKQTPEQLVETALQEDVDLLAVSSLAGAHMSIARDTLALLKQRGASDVRLVMGGIIPEEDRQPLLELGVEAVFTPKDSNLGKIVSNLIAMSEARA